MSGNEFKDAIMLLCLALISVTTCLCHIRKEFGPCDLRSQVAKQLSLAHRFLHMRLQWA